MAGKVKVDSAATVAALAEIDVLLAQAGMTQGGRATRRGLKGLRRDEKAFKEWPKAGEIRRWGGIEVLVAPEWERGELEWLRHGFSTRVGGASRIYLGGADAAQGELNLSWTKEDEAAFVEANRDHFVAAVAGRREARAGKGAGRAEARTGKGEARTKARLVTLRQIHSGLVHVVVGATAAAAVQGSSLPLATADGRAVFKGDGAMTDVPGLVLGIQTADCVPVLVADTRRRAVAAFHAGWRGTLARIAERGVGRMRLEYGSRPKDLIAAIGPSIGPCCYSVGEEVRQEFASQFAYAEELFSEVYDRDPIREKYPMLFLTQRAPGHSDIGPQTHLDLWGANLRQLLDAGVKRENITVAGECTACNPARYFSHRAQHGFTGRMMNAVGVAAKRS